MKKSQFKETCKYFEINEKALKECMKKQGLKRKDATEREVLEVIFINAPDLMWCRSEGGGIVEYYDKSMPIKMSEALSKAMN